MKTIFWDEETARIRDAIREHFPDVDEQVRQTLCLAEEVGEFVGASRRFLDMARRPGSRDEVVTECADVIITALITALVFDFDIWSAVDDKLAVIQTRGYRQPRTDRDD